MKNELTNRIALAVAAKGGRAYYVGGCVRDSLLQHECPGDIYAAAQLNKHIEESDAVCTAGNEYKNATAHDGKYCHDSKTTFGTGKNNINAQAYEDKYNKNSEAIFVDINDNIIEKEHVGKSCPTPEVSYSSEINDIDIEVFGLYPKQLEELLSDFGELQCYGSSFGIFSLKGQNIDFAIPRKEHCKGKGHRAFDISCDPFIDTKDAARRRDFTVNALMQDILSGEIIDHFGGLSDLKNRTLRMVDENSFSEDPLRVLRGAQFAARFGFAIEEKTQKHCSLIDLSALSKERVQEEMKKALLKSSKPSVFFECLKNMDQLNLWFKEVYELIGIPQDPVFHPEGVVFTHTMEVIDRGAALRNNCSDPYSFMLLCLTHDFGKIVSTEEIEGRIHAYGHEVSGIPAIEAFAQRLGFSNAVRNYLLNMVPLHMKPNLEAYSKPAVKSTNKMFDAAICPKDLIYFAMSDKPVMSGSTPFGGDSGFLFERLNVYNKIMEKPFVSGRDLQKAGLLPGEWFSELLSYAHKLRLAGIEKDFALKQTLAYARKFKK